METSLDHHASTPLLGFEEPATRRGVKLQLDDRSTHELENKPRGRAQRAASEAVRQGERIQQAIDAKDKIRPQHGDGEQPMQAGTREYPDKFPAQHLTKPGEEAKLKQQPMYEAPGYRGSEKLKDMVAIITGGDFGIGRAVAVLYAREGADIAIVYLKSMRTPKRRSRRSRKKGDGAS